MSLYDNEKLRKVPWGVIGGICIIAVFYITAGIIAAYIITNAVAGATNRSVGLFGSWWQTLLFILDIVLALACVWSFVMRFLVRGRKAVKGGAEE